MFVSTVRTPDSLKTVQRHSCLCFAYNYLEVKFVFNSYKL